MIHIIDYGVGNLAAIRNMLGKVGAPSTITSDPAEIARATKLILPGVGSFDQGMRSLAERGLVEVLTRKAIDERVPVLGVCLGMQMLCTSSDEGREPGLGWIRARLRRFGDEAGTGRFKRLHMGWNVARPTRPTPLFAGLGDEPRFYFVHGYYCVVDDEADAIARTEYGVSFASAIGRDNIWGVQFHPEKSHRFGKQLYRNFVERI